MMQGISTLLAFAAPLLLSVSISAYAIEDVPLSLTRRDPAACTFVAKNPPPAGFVCGAQGSVSNPAVIASGNAPNLETCRDRCLNNQPQCVSFSYGPGKRCTTYPMKIVNSGFKRGTTGKIFYNRNCYRKVCTCPAGQAKCGANCYNLSTDLANCGSCGNACGTGALCTNGTCSCSAGSGLCSGPNGPCQDTNSDASNCGSCGNACGQGASCSNSTCTCATGSALCSGPNGPCQDVKSDASNCGSCGNSCGQGAFCSNGVCSCSAGSGLCSGANGPCQDITSDPKNCGGCNNGCRPGESCSSSNCRCSSTSGGANGQCGPSEECIQSGNPITCGSEDHCCREIPDKEYFIRARTTWRQYFAGVGKTRDQGTNYLGSGQVDAGYTERYAEQAVTICFTANQSPQNAQSVNAFWVKQQGGHWQCDYYSNNDTDPASFNQNVPGAIAETYGYYRASG